MLTHAEKNPQEVSTLPMSSLTDIPLLEQAREMVCAHAYKDEVCFDQQQGAVPVRLGGMRIVRYFANTMLPYFSEHFPSGLHLPLEDFSPVQASLSSLAHYPSEALPGPGTGLQCPPVCQFQSCATAGSCLTKCDWLF